MSELKMEEISNDFAKLREMLGLNGADEALVGQAFGMLNQLGSKKEEVEEVEKTEETVVDQFKSQMDVTTPPPSPNSASMPLNNPLSFLPAFSRMETTASSLEVTPFTLSQLGSMTPLGGLTPGFGQGQAVEWPAVNGVPVLAMGLQSTVQHVQGEDTARIIVLRRIHKLGFSAPTEIINHFQKFCEVDRLLLLPSRRKFGKLRPSSTGFLVCRSAEGAEKIFASCLPSESNSKEDVSEKKASTSPAHSAADGSSTPEKSSTKGRKYGTENPLLQTVSGQVIEVGSFEYPTNVSPCTTPSAAAHALQQSIAALLTPMNALGSHGSMTPTNFGFGLIPPFTPQASTATPASTPIAGEYMAPKLEAKEVEGEEKAPASEGEASSKDSKALNPEAAVFVPTAPPSLLAMAAASPPQPSSTLPEPSPLGALGGVNPSALANPLLTSLGMSGSNPFLPHLPSPFLDPSVGLLAQQILAQQNMLLQLQSMAALNSFQ